MKMKPLLAACPGSGLWSDWLWMWLVTICCLFINAVASHRALHLPGASAGTGLLSCNWFSMLLYLWSGWRERIGALVSSQGLIYCTSFLNRYFEDFASARLWSSKETEEWGWEFKICNRGMQRCGDGSLLHASLLWWMVLSSWVLGHGAHQRRILHGAGCEPRAWQGSPALMPNQYRIARQAVTVILPLTALFMSRPRSDTCCPEVHAAVLALKELEAVKAACVGRCERCQGSCWLWTWQTPLRSWRSCSVEEGYTAPPLDKASIYT